MRVSDLGNNDFVSGPMKLWLVGSEERPKDTLPLSRAQSLMRTASTNQIITKEMSKFILLSVLCSERKDEK